MYLFSSHRTSTASTRGMTLKPNIVVVTEVDDTAMPHFGSIQEIFVDTSSRILLGVYVLEVVEYSSHFYSWVIQLTSERQIVPADSICSRQCSTARYINTLPIAYKLVTLKYALVTC